MPLSGAKAAMLHTGSPGFCTSMVKIWWLSLCSLVVGSAMANGLEISELQLVNRQQLTLRISWQNAWLLSADQPPANHDAIWLFGKYRVNGQWKHLRLATESAGFEAETPLMTQPASDGLGAWVRLADTLQGHVAPTLITLRLAEPLDPRADGLRLSGIEMAWVSKGAYYLGDGASKHHLGNGLDLGPLRINSEDRLLSGSQANTLSLDGVDPPAGDIPAHFPKGFAGFYLMKYEISQGQFVDFLNCLTLSQQRALTRTDPSLAAGNPALFFEGIDSKRNNIRIAQPAQEPSPASYQTNTPDRACNFLSWKQLTAYLDWAALRPMSEMEFEKAARGFASPQPKDMAWGTAFSVNANTPEMDGTARESVSEQASDSAGLANHGDDFLIGFLQGPLRCGFGADTANHRLQAGAGYFGHAELSGNVWELVVNLNAAGLAFDGQHGDGQLPNAGLADVPNWPDPISADGAGQRGGAWNSWIKNDLAYEFRDLAISDRFYIYLAPTQHRNTTGGRGARSF